MVGRGQQGPSQQPMNRSDDAVENDKLYEFVCGHRQNAAHQHLFDVLGALRGAIDDEHRRSRGDHIKDANEGFLPHAAGKAAACGQQQSARRREDERVGIAGGALNGVACDRGHRGAQRRHLRQRKIGEHHVPPQHLEAKPSMNAGEDDGCGERQRRECEDVLKHGSAQFDAADSARANVATL